MKKSLPLFFVLALVACSEHKSFDKSFAECRYEMMKARMTRPDMKFDKDSSWDVIFQRGLVIECMKVKGFESIPADKLELIN